jgi:hypothetical protein
MLHTYSALSFRGYGRDMADKYRIIQYDVRPPVTALCTVVRVISALMFCCIKTGNTHLKYSTS